MKSLSDLTADMTAPLRWAPSPTLRSDQLGDELKQMFGQLTAGPMPDRMVQLANALEEAFRRGDLFDSDTCRLS